jgi:hypothetical protein
MIAPSSCQQGGEVSVETEGRERLTSSQNSRSLATRFSRALPAIIAELIPPIEVPATQALLLLALASSTSGAFRDHLVDRAKTK